jgi:hypothetical protein
LKAATLAREGHHIFIATIFAFHMGKREAARLRKKEKPPLVSSGRLIQAKEMAGLIMLAVLQP